MKSRVAASGADESWRYKRRIQEIERLLPRGFQPRQLLDVGCAEGSITAPLGAHFGLPKENIHGCDVRDIPHTAGMQFLVFDGARLDAYATDSFCMVTMLMALHHVADMAALLREVHRVLRPGGVLVIREHDCTPQRLALVLDVQHGFFSKVWSDPPEWPSFCKEYFAEYRGRREWSDAIARVGLVQLLDTDQRRRLYSMAEQSRPGRNGYIKNPNKYYYAIYRKPGACDELLSLGEHALHRGGGHGHSGHYSHRGQQSYQPRHQPHHGRDHHAWRRNKGSPEWAGPSRAGQNIQWPRGRQGDTRGGQRQRRHRSRSRESRQQGRDWR